jgi:hypothetical protein
MLVVKIELWPFGDAARAKEIARTYIWNQGTGTKELGDYGVHVCKEGDFQHPLDGYPAERSADIGAYPRRLPVWHLIIRALRATFPEEK